MRFIRKHYFLLALTIIIAVFLRLYQITNLPPGLYPDEAMNGNNALEALRTMPFGSGFKIFYPENTGREGLFINIQAIFLKLIGQNEPWVLRLSSAIFGIFTVIGLYFLAKKMFSPTIGILAAFLMATSFWHINFSRIGFRAIAAPFFLTWAIYFLFLAFDRLKTNKRNYFIAAAISGLLYGFGFHTYIAYRVTPILLVFIFWIFGKRQGLAGTTKILLVFLILGIVVSLPLIIYFWNSPEDFFGRTGQISILNSPTPFKDLGFNVLKTFGMFNVAGDWNWRHNIAGRPLLFWPVGIFFLIGLALSIFGKRKSVIPLFWLATTALPVVISNEGIPHALRSILMAPPVFILAATGGMRLYYFLKSYLNPKLLAVSGYALLVLLVFEAYYSYFIVWAQNSNTVGAFAQNYAEIGRQLNALPKELPKYVVVKASGIVVRGIPMPAQTIMFITDTFLPEKQKEKNIYYVLPENIQKIPPNSYVVNLE